MEHMVVLIQHEVGLVYVISTLDGSIVTSIPTSRFPLNLNWNSYEDVKDCVGRLFVPARSVVVH